MRQVCIFNGDMSRGGGTERIAQLLSSGLANREGYDVIVLSLSNATDDSYYPLHEKVRHRSLKEKSIMGRIRELRRFLRTEAIDVLINVDVMLGIYSIPAVFGMRKRTKLISWEMFNIRNDIGSKHTDLIRRVSLGYCDAYICQTEGDMKAFEREMPVRCLLSYIYNPCVYDEAYVDYDAGSKTIMTAGHFFHTKGYDLAVEVAAEVFPKHPDWEWRFYGDGPQMEAVKKQATKLGVRNNVVFCGRTKNMTDAYRHAAMYVMTSRTEGFGLVLTEAKANNLPTLAFDVEFGPREIIESGVSGELVGAFDVKGMASAICGLIEDTERRKLYSQQARINLNKFSEKGFVDNWIRIMEAL